MRRSCRAGVRISQMRRYSQRQSLSSLSEINIPPLLDLAFVLLIIFMITTPLLESSMSLIIPSSGGKNPPVTSSQVQTVSIDRNETIRLNNRLVDLSALSAQLGEIKRTHPHVAVVIRPDRDLPVQNLFNLLYPSPPTKPIKIDITPKPTPTQPHT